MLITPVFAGEYTYDGDIDPMQFFSYTPVDFVPLNEVLTYVHLVNKTKTPTTAINIVMRSQEGYVLIVAYAHLDKDLKLKFFNLITQDKKAHYTEMK